MRALGQLSAQCCAPQLPRPLGGGMPAQRAVLSDAEPAAYFLRAVRRIRSLYHGRL